MWLTWRTLVFVLQILGTTWYAVQDQQPSYDFIFPPWPLYKPVPYQPRPLQDFTLPDKAVTNNLDGNFGSNKEDSTNSEVYSLSKERERYMLTAEDRHTMLPSYMKRDILNLLRDEQHNKYFLEGTLNSSPEGRKLLDDWSLSRIRQCAIQALIQPYSNQIWLVHQVARATALEHNLPKNIMLALLTESNYNLCVQKTTVGGTQEPMHKSYVTDISMANTELAETFETSTASSSTPASEKTLNYNTPPHQKTFPEIRSESSVDFQQGSAPIAPGFAYALQPHLSVFKVEQINLDEKLLNENNNSVRQEATPVPQINHSQAQLTNEVTATNTNKFPLGAVIVYLGNKEPRKIVREEILQDYGLPSAKDVLINNNFKSPTEFEPNHHRSKRSNSSSLSTTSFDEPSTEENNEATATILEVIPIISVPGDIPDLGKEINVIKELVDPASTVEPPIVLKVERVPTHIDTSEFWESGRNDHVQESSTVNSLNTKTFQSLNSAVSEIPSHNGAIDNVAQNEEFTTENSEIRQSKMLTENKNPSETFSAKFNYEVLKKQHFYTDQTTENFETFLAEKTTKATTMRDYNDQDVTVPLTEVENTNNSEGDFDQKGFLNETAHQTIIVAGKSMEAAEGKDETSSSHIDISTDEEVARSRNKFDSIYIGKTTPITSSETFSMFVEGVTENQDDNAQSVEKAEEPNMGVTTAWEYATERRYETATYTTDEASAEDNKIFAVTEGPIEIVSHSEDETSTEKNKAFAITEEPNEIETHSTNEISTENNKIYANTEESFEMTTYSRGEISTEDSKFSVIIEESVEIANETSTEESKIPATTKESVEVTIHTSETSDVNKKIAVVEEPFEITTHFTDETSTKDSNVPAITEESIKIATHSIDETSTKDSKVPAITEESVEIATHSTVETSTEDSKVAAITEESVEIATHFTVETSTEDSNAPAITEQQVEIVTHSTSETSTENTVTEGSVNLTPHTLHKASNEEIKASTHTGSNENVARDLDDAYITEGSVQDTTHATNETFTENNKISDVTELIVTTPDEAIVRGFDAAFITDGTGEIVTQITSETNPENSEPTEITTQDYGTAFSTAEQKVITYTMGEMPTKTTPTIPELMGYPSYNEQITVSPSDRVVTEHLYSNINSDKEPATTNHKDLELEHYTQKMFQNDNVRYVTAEPNEMKFPRTEHLSEDTPIRHFRFPVVYAARRILNPHENMHMNRYGRNFHFMDEIMPPMQIPQYNIPDAYTSYYLAVLRDLEETMRTRKARNANDDIFKSDSEGESYAKMFKAHGPEESQTKNELYSIHFPIEQHEDGSSDGNNPLQSLHTGTKHLTENGPSDIENKTPQKVSGSPSMSFQHQSEQREADSFAHDAATSRSKRQVQRANFQNFGRSILKLLRETTADNTAENTRRGSYRGNLIPMSQEKIPKSSIQKISWNLRNRKRKSVDNDIINKPESDNSIDEEYASILELVDMNRLRQIVERRKLAV